MQYASIFGIYVLKKFSCSLFYNVHGTCSCTFCEQKSGYNLKLFLFFQPITLCSLFQLVHETVKK